MKLPPNFQPRDLNFLHLQAELARIDLLIQRQALRWQTAGQDPQDAFRGLYIADSEASALMKRPFAGNWGSLGPLSPDQEAEFNEALAQAAEAARTFMEQAQAQGVELRLVRLAEFFDLDTFDVNILLVCLAPTLDLRYERLFGYLQDDVTRKRPSVNLILDLLCEPGSARLEHLSRFSANRTLFSQRLLEKSTDSAAPLLSQTLAVDESIFAWLLGYEQVHTDLMQFTSLKPAQPTDLADLAAAQLRPALDGAGGETPVLVLYGRDEAGQDAAAHFVAAQQGLSLLIVHMDRLAAAVGQTTDEDGLRLALREARLLGAVPYLRNWDACLQDGAPPAALLAEICAFPGAAVIASREAWRAAGIDRQRSLRWVELDIPSYRERRMIWQHYLEKTDPLEGDVDLTALAGQFQLTTGQIRDAVTAARDQAQQAGEPMSNLGLFAAARLYSNPRLSSLARKLQPRFGWEDIVLPADQIRLLREIVNTVRQRPRVLDEWGVGRKLASSRGVTILFAGPPGTGKTMAAEVIAAELGLDLYKIDLSTVVSKYIGETEKNLERIFNEAETSNAILFFDEADSLFGKRSEVRDSHDRYANIEISYLLQRMEAYDGVTMLATNLRANLDEAFTRRLQFAVDFPFPEETDRLRIWKTLFPPELPCGADVDLTILARRFKLAGGNIRNIIVNAAFLAAEDGGAVSMRHILHGARRELQKMGRLVSEGDMVME
jgi:hypothetical protein